ncbi:MAG: hypothetical protein NT056_07005 [Proteobacteria bacterium]|nr:hypothetical protein [Pseudomonadota bacterium]
MKKGILLLPLFFWFVFFLFPAPAPGAEVARSFIERLVNNTDPVDQEFAIRAVIRNPQRHKPELLA